MNTPVYMDHHATTPVDPRVLQAMLPYFSRDFGNAASRTHEFGWRAAEAVQVARETVAGLIGAEMSEVIFTSGATESNNLAITGAALANRARGNHIVTVATEHRAVLDPCRVLEGQGFEVTVLPVQPDGLLDLDLLRDRITGRTILLSVMAANNETGVIQPLAEIGRIAAERGALFHVDAAQALGRIPLGVAGAGIHLMSMSAHKVYGPKGVGALYVRRREPRVRLEALQHGGGHERGLRSGTLNVPGIVGFGRACDILRTEMPAETRRMEELRDLLLRLLSDQVPDLVVNGSMESRLPNNLNVSFAHVEGESLITAMRDVAVSSGSACTSASNEPSHVLAAMDAPPELSHSSIRFGLGRWNTREEVEYVATRVADTVRRLRALSPWYAPPA